MLLESRITVIRFFFLEMSSNGVLDPQKSNRFEDAIRVSSLPSRLSTAKEHHCHSKVHTIKPRPLQHGFFSFAEMILSNLGLSLLLFLREE